VATTVLGGLILWSMTSSTPPMPAAQRAPAEPPAAMAGSPVPAITAREPLAPRTDAMPLIPMFLPGPTAAAAPPLRSLWPYSVPVGTILLYEDFAGYRDGDAVDWGPDTFIKTGLDCRHWLVSSVAGTHPVGCRIRLPSEWYFECRYSAYMPEVTRGLLGWWKEPLSTGISFLDDQGARYAVQWVIKCGPDPTRLNPLGSSSLCAKKYYHTVKLPDGSSNEVGAIQPAGWLRIDCGQSGVTVRIDGQTVVTGTTRPSGQIVAFEINVVNAKNRALFFTDFKIGR